MFLISVITYLLCIKQKKITRYLLIVDTITISREKRRDFWCVCSATSCRELFHSTQHTTQAQFVHVSYVPALRTRITDLYESYDAITIVRWQKGKANTQAVSGLLFDSKWVWQGHMYQTCCVRIGCSSFEILNLECRSCQSMEKKLSGNLSHTEPGVPFSLVHRYVISILIMIM